MLARNVLNFFVTKIVVVHREENLYDSACESIIDVARLHQGVAAVESERGSFIIQFHQINSSLCFLRTGQLSISTSIMSHNERVVYTVVSVGILIAALLYFSGFSISERSMACFGMGCFWMTECLIRTDGR